jgi:hypothetical protein
MIFNSGDTIAILIDMVTGMVMAIHIITGNPIMKKRKKLKDFFMSYTNGLKTGIGQLIKKWKIKKLDS